MSVTTDNDMQQVALEVKTLVMQLMANGRSDLALKAIGTSTLELLRIEAARARLSQLVVTADYRFLLPAYGNREVQLSPIHKALYILFLRHPEGIELKCLCDHRAELLAIYKHMASWVDVEKVGDVVDRLVNPLDNAFNEKCSRIKAAFSSLMDSYAATYYIISGRKVRSVDATGHVWFERKKVVSLPRELVVWEQL